MSASKQPSQWRRIGFWLLGLLMAGFLVGEFLVPSESPRPGVSTEVELHLSSPPVFQVQGERVELRQERLSRFDPVSFPAKKSAKGFRCFVLGDSVVMGRPHSHEVAFPVWLQKALAFHEPDREWEMINCGAERQDSLRTLHLLREVLAYEPDLIIVHVGHGEFLDDLPATRESVGNTVAETSPSPFGTRLWRLWQRQGQTLKPAPPVQTRAVSLPADPSPYLENEDGMDYYYRDEAWKKEVHARFEANLRDMAAACQAAKVPLILSVPVANLRGVAPFKSEPKQDLSEEQKKELAKAREDGENMRKQQRYEQAAEAFHEAIELDDLDASLRFLMANVLDISGRWNEARELYQAANDLDVCPLRVTSELCEIIRKVGRGTNTPVVDLPAEVAKVVRDGIPGDREEGGYVDYIHPNIAGHQYYAGAFYEQMAKMGIVPLKADWANPLAESWHDYLRALPDDYWLKGEERQERIDLLAQAKAASKPKRVPGARQPKHSPREPAP